MSWIEKKEHWLDKKKETPTPRVERMVQKSYSIPEVADLCSVSRDTVYKWLAFDCPEEAVIPPSAWYRLDNGRIRIKEWIVEKIQNHEA